ncbi:hypothetical protein VNO77_10106 [Canavalia gladiata]|uniref:Uncharacterized protein n=1 Tax=Canavalia gladiata TaxID=3824 RepID=A0AAN9MDP8_CANGL
MTKQTIELQVLQKCDSKPSSGSLHNAPVDSADLSIFGVILELLKLPSTSPKGCVLMAPKYAIAFRGTLTGAETRSRDLLLDLKCITNTLHRSSRFKMAMHSIQKMVDLAGVANVWIRYLFCTEGEDGQNWSCANIENIATNCYCGQFTIDCCFGRKFRTFASASLSGTNSKYGSVARFQSTTWNSTMVDSSVTISEVEEVKEERAEEDIRNYNSGKEMEKRVGITMMDRDYCSDDGSLFKKIGNDNKARQKKTKSGLS